MSNGFFSGSNPLFRLTGRVLDLVVLSFFFLLASLPVVTLGPAAAALYYSSVKCLRRGEGSPYRSFWASFRENLRPGIGATVILLIIAVALDALFVFLTMAAATGSTAWNVARWAFLVSLLLPAAMYTLTFPLLSRFTCTAGGLLANALRLTVRHLPAAVGAGILNAALVVLTLKTWFYGSVLLTPALGALAVSFLLEPVLRRYTPQAAEGEDIPWYLR
ncbi:MAG: YesL family protein [Dysosmobacter sp.]|jgi:uncharacterized membrane protein YesL|uniref:YesL family protein n=1 Tax=Dysosmobacter sp. TaxID=2591382 RepID=UPI003D8FBFBC